jgi:hypothetical protein
MIDWTKPIETMEGWKAKVVSTDYKTYHSILYVVQIDRPSAFSVLVWYKENGQPYGTETLLRNVKVKKEGWVNIYAVYKTEEEAKRACVDADRNCHRFVKWEE